MSWFPRLLWCFSCISMLSLWFCVNSQGWCHVDSARLGSFKITFNGCHCNLNHDIGFIGNIVARVVCHSTCCVRLSKRGVVIAVDKSPSLYRLANCSRQDQGRNAALATISFFDKPPSGKISQSVEVSRFMFSIVLSMWNSIDSSAELLQRRLLNFHNETMISTTISLHQDFTKSYDIRAYRTFKWWGLQIRRR